MNELVGVGRIHGTRNALSELRQAIDRILDVQLPDAASKDEAARHQDIDPEAWRRH